MTADTISAGIDAVAENRVIGISVTAVSRVAVAGPITISWIAVAGSVTIAVSRIAITIAISRVAVAVAMIGVGAKVAVVVTGIAKISTDAIGAADRTAVHAGEREGRKRPADDGVGLGDGGRDTIKGEWQRSAEHRRSDEKLFHESYSIIVTLTSPHGMLTDDWTSFL